MTWTNIVGIVAILALIALAIGVMVVLIRNQWIYDERMKILNREPVGSGLEEYDSLISYDDMMRKWWVWDIEKLKK